MDLSEVGFEIRKKSFENQRSIYAVLGQMVLEDAAEGRAITPQAVAARANTLLDIYREEDHVHA